MTIRGQRSLSDKPPIAMATHVPPPWLLSWREEGGEGGGGEDCVEAVLKCEGLDEHSRRAMAMG